MMDETKKLYLKTAVLAGEILMESNAEAYRVEETVNHILDEASFNKSDVIALTTGLYVSVEEESFKPFTLIRRIKNRAINLYRITKVNEISRQIKSKEINISNAYEALVNLKNSEYKSIYKDLAIALFILSIVLLFNGNLVDVVSIIPVALLVSLILNICRKYRIHIFVTDFIACFVVSLFVSIINNFIVKGIHFDILIISCIMPLVPGTALTNGIRDIFRGDYTSGFAKLLESIMIALFIALGIGAGLLFVQEVLGWIF